MWIVLMDFKYEFEIESAGLSEELDGESIKRKSKMTRTCLRFLLNSSECSGTILGEGQVSRKGQRWRSMIQFSLDKYEIF